MGVAEEVTVSLLLFYTNDNFGAYAGPGNVVSIFSPLSPPFVRVWSSVLHKQSYSMHSQFCLPSHQKDSQAFH